MSTKIPTPRPNAFKIGIKEKGEGVKCGVKSHQESKFSISPEKYNLAVLFGKSYLNKLCHKATNNASVYITALQSHLYKSLLYPQVIHRNKQLSVIDIVATVSLYRCI